MWRALLVTTFALSGACSPPNPVGRDGQQGASSKAMSFDRVEYTVATRPQVPESLIVSRTGAARYASHANAGNPGRPEIGVYEWTLSPAEVASLGGVLGADFASLPDHMGKIFAGDRFREVTLITGGGATTKAVGTHLPVDARVSAMMNHLDGIVLKAYDHPRQVLSIAVSGAVVKPDRTAELVLTLTGKGTQLVTCRAPTALKSAPDGWIQIKLWPDLPSDKLGAHNIWSVKASDVEDAQNPLSYISILDLAPGASASYRVRARLPDATPGASILVVSYANFAAGPPEKQLLVGEVVSTRVPVEVR